MTTLLLLAALCLPAQATDADATAADDWTVEVVAELGEKLGGVAFGDVDPDLAGHELVTVSVSGRITVLGRGDDGAWTRQLVGDVPGEMIQVAAVDLIPEVPGDEIAAVGMAEGDEDSGGEGAAWVFHREGDGWQGTEVLRAPALLHCVAAAELDGERGLELLVAGFDDKATALAWREGAWAVHDDVRLPGAAKAATPWLGGLALACRDGSVIKVRGTRRGLTTHEVLGPGPGVARIGSDMTRLLVAGDDGALTLVDGTGYPKSETVIYQVFDKLRGAVIADVSPRGFGDELCTTGYDGKVVVLGASPEPLVVADDGQALHHLAAGPLDGRTVLATCGYSGRVLVIRGPTRRGR